MSKGCKICQGRESEPLGRLIYQTSQILQNYADKALRPYALTLEQLHPIKVVYLAGRAMTQREICELTRKSAANLTRILDRLEAKELIVRSQNPQDRRAFLVSLTAKGEEVVGEVTRFFEKLSREMLQGISKSDQKITQKTMHRLVENVEILAQNLETPKT